MKTTRIYEVPATVTATVGNKEHTEERVYLVEATGKAAARAHVADKFVGEAELAAPKRIVELMGDGHKVEIAKSED